MITKWIEFKVAENDAAVMAEELQKMEIASVAEDGCALYRAFASSDDPCVLTVIEAWETEEAFEAHRASDHMGAFKAKCGSMILDKNALSLDALVPTDHS